MKNVAAVAILLLSVSVSFGADRTLVVGAGDLDRRDTIITFPITAETLFGERETCCTSVVLRDGDRELPADWMPLPCLDPAVTDRTGLLLFRLARPLIAGTTRTYSLLLTQKDTSDAPFTEDRVTGDRVTIGHRGKPVLCYNDGIQRYEPDPDSFLSRSGYVHPLWSPKGHIVTGDRCPDHPHQRGFFFAWTQCTFQGQEVNFWEMRTGRSKTVAPPEVTLGRAAAFLVAKNELIANGVPALNETFRYAVYAGQQDGWTIDFWVDHQAITDPLWVEKYLYGGCAFRGPESWLKIPLDVSTSEGLSGREANGTRAAWCLMAGPVGETREERAGVTYFDDPANPRYPTFLRIHPEKPYFCFAYHQREGLCIDRAHPVRLHYRILVHDDEPDRARLEALAADLRLPPLVSLVTDPPSER